MLTSCRLVLVLPEPHFPWEFCAAYLILFIEEGAGPGASFFEFFSIITRIRVRTKAWRWNLVGEGAPLELGHIDQSEAFPPS